MNKLEEQSITGSKGKWFRELFFYLGIVGALGLRAVLILNNFDPFYAKLSWYASMFSLTAFYYYRLWIENRRRTLILDADLIVKLAENRLSKDDRDKISTLLNSTIISKQKINLSILFVASIIALIIQIAIDYKIFL